MSNFPGKPPTMESMVKLALIGLGAIAVEAHLPALRARTDVELVAVADPDPARRARLTREQIGSASVVVDLAAALALVPDGVVLATPPWVTTELIADCCRAGVPVLAEKPISTDPESARRLLALPGADRVQVGLTYRHDPAIAELRELIRGGHLGDPLLFRGHVYDEQSGAGPEHEALIRRTLARGTPVVHEGAHLLDWLVHLTGRQPRVDDGWSLRSDPSLPADNLCGGRLRFDDGSIALVEFGWFTPALPRCELGVTGPKGSAVLDAKTFDLRVELAGDPRPTTRRHRGDRVCRSFTRQLEVFITMISHDNPADPGLADGLNALELATELAARAQRTPSTGRRP